MSCKPTYKGVRYNSLEELYNANRQNNQIDAMPMSNQVDAMPMDMDTSNQYSAAYLAERTPAELKFIETQRKLIHSRNLAIANLKQQKTDANVNKNYGKVITLDSRIEDLENQIESIKDALYLSEIKPIAERDLETLNDLLNGEITEKDLEYAKRITDMWQHSYELFFDDATKKSEALEQYFGGVSNAMSDLANKFDDIALEFIENYTKEHTNNTRDFKTVFTEQKDPDAAWKLTFDISRFNNPYLSTMYTMVQNANMDAKREADVIIKKANELLAKAQPELRKLNAKRGYKREYDAFRQTYDDGRYTGNTISMYSRKFYEDMSEKYNKYKFASNRVSAFADFMNFKKHNVNTLDLTILFPIQRDSTTDERREAYIAELTDQLGAGIVGELLLEQEKLLDRFNETEQSVKDTILAKYKGTDFETLIKENPSARDEHNIWLVKNSPYRYLVQLEKEEANEYGGQRYTSEGYEYVVEFPKKQRKVVINGQDTMEETGYYDSKFTDVYENPVLFEFYTFMTNTFKDLNKFLPQEAQEEMKFNAFPFIKQGFLELYNERGFREAGKNVKDEIINAVRTTNLSQQSSNEQEFGTNREEKDLGVNFIRNAKQQISEEMTRRSMAYRLENNVDKVPDDVRKEWRRELADKYAREQSYDLGKVLKAYSLLVLGYKHKARIEDKVNLINNAIQDLKEYEKNAAGEIVYNTNTNEKKYVENKGAFKNLKEASQYYVDVTMYGKGRADEGVTNIKRYTSAEKKIMKDIDHIIELVKNNDELEPEQKQANLDMLNKQKDMLGGYVTASGLGDQALRWVQLKGMGWNVFGAISNIGFGVMANIITSQDERIMSQKSFQLGYKYTMASVLRNASFDKANIPMAMKIRGIMDKLDILKDASHELFNETADDRALKKWKWLSPYNLQKRSEYINQSPIMIALLLDTKFTTETGEEISLWDGFNDEGEWNTEAYGAEPAKLINKTNLKINQIIKMTHGNYDTLSPILIKDKILGRMISQFRTWMFEGFASRYEPSKYDDILEIEIKGRYRSIVPYIKGAGGVGSIFSLLMDMMTMISPMHKTDLSRHGLSQLDAINMKKNLTELWMFIGIASSIATLRMLTGELDDEEKYLVNHAVNQAMRLQTDISFYFSPTEFRKLIKDPLPVTTIIKDSVAVVDALVRAVQGDDIIGSGVHEGDSRVLNRTLTFFPFTTILYRWKNAGRQQFDD